MKCVKCDGEIADSAVVCKYCHAELGKPKRPAGVTVIAVLVLIGSIVNLLALFNVGRQPLLLLGFPVSMPVMQLALLACVLISLFCGIGLFKLSPLARSVYIGYALFGMANTLGTACRLLTSPFCSEQAKNTITLGVFFAIAVPGLIIVYLFSRRDYFIKH